MTKKELQKYIIQGDEIEFEYDNKRFSITYGEFNGEDMISFCEFYRETTEVKSIEELLKIERYGVTVENMLASCAEENILIF